jgi:hypothetical protein
MFGKKTDRKGVLQHSVRLNDQYPTHVALLIPDKLDKILTSS